MRKNKNYVILLDFMIIIASLLCSLVNDHLYQGLHFINWFYILFIMILCVLTIIHFIKYKQVNNMNLHFLGVILLSSGIFHRLYQMDTLKQIFPILNHLEYNMIYVVVIAVIIILILLYMNGIQQTAEVKQKEISNRRKLSLLICVVIVVMSIYFLNKNISDYTLLIQDLIKTIFYVFIIGIVIILAVTATIILSIMLYNYVKNLLKKLKDESSNIRYAYLISIITISFLAMLLDTKFSLDQLLDLQTKGNLIALFIAILILVCTVSIFFHMILDLAKDKHIKKIAEAAEKLFINLCKIVNDSFQAVIDLLAYIPNIVSIIFELKQTDEKVKLKQGTILFASLFAFVSWYTTKNGLSQFVLHGKEWQANLISLAIQGLLFSLSIKAFKIKDKDSNDKPFITFMKKHIKKIAILLLMIISSTFSFVFMSDEIYTDTLYANMNNSVTSIYENTKLDLDKYLSQALVITRNNIIQEISKMMMKISIDDNAMNKENSNSELNISENERALFLEDGIIYDDIMNGHLSMSYKDLYNQMDKKISSIDEEIDKNYATDPHDRSQLAIYVYENYGLNDTEIKAKQTALSNLTKKQNAYKKLQSYLQIHQTNKNQINLYLINLLTEIEKDKPVNKAIDNNKNELKNCIYDMLKTKNDQTFQETMNNYAEIDNEIDIYTTLNQTKTDLKDLNKNDMKANKASGSISKAFLWNPPKKDDDDKRKETWVTSWSDKFDDLKLVIEQLNFHITPKNATDSVSKLNYHVNKEIDHLNDTQLSYLGKVNTLERAKIMLFSRNNFQSIVALFIAVLLDIMAVIVGFINNHMGS